MKTLLHTPVTYLWLLLVTLTVFSCAMADGFIPGPNAAYQWLTLVLVFVAFFKVRLVIMHFMEVATAPIPLRIVFEVWVLVVCGAILFLYLGYIHLPS